MSTWVPRTSDQEEPIHRIDSPRAGGSYLIEHYKHDFGKYERDNRCKARLTTWIIEQQRLDKDCPMVTEEIIEEARAATNMRIRQRADRILTFLADKTHKAGSPVAMNSDPDSWQGMSDASEAYLELLAHSESVGDSPGDPRNDLKFLLGYLESRDMIKPPNFSNRQFDLTLTVPGLERVEDLRQEVNPISDQAFVAMWIHDETTDMWKTAIKPAIRKAGYDPVRVDEQHYVGNVVDRIITEIRRSRFIVVDYTEGSGGTRGSVYYEAGFARGMGLRVISTCRKGAIGDVHFDVRQDNHIEWEDVEDLKRLLEERITAVMGDGPLKGQKSK